MRELFKRWCSSLCPDARTDEYCPAEQEGAELAKVVAFVQNTMRYADAATIARSRPVGPATGEQLRHIRDLAAKHRYTDALLNKLLFNRLGKDHLQALTRAEASQFLTYLRSPCAVY
jgi:hypothetical protein